MTRKPRRSKPAQKDSTRRGEPTREASARAPDDGKLKAEAPAAKQPATTKPATTKPATTKPAATKTKPAARKTARKTSAKKSDEPSKKSDETKTSDEASVKSGKVTLPAFGFAADLLPKSGALETQQKESSPRDDTSADAAAPDAAASIDENDPRRIFAFADSLDAGASEKAATPVRLETWVAFSLASEIFALPVAPIREVVRVSSITRVPHAPKPIRGVTNRRGRVIPVIDLRMRIELPAAELGRASRVIVVSSRGRLLGLLVDAVHQVIHIDLDQVQPPPDDVMTVQSDYLSGVYHLEDRLILLLDVDRALIVQGPAEPGSGPETFADSRADAATSSPS